MEDLTENFVELISIHGYPRVSTYNGKTLSRLCQDRHFPLQVLKKVPWKKDIKLDCAISMPTLSKEKIRGESKYMYKMLRI